MSPEIAKAQTSMVSKTMHHILDSLGLPLADILSLFNDVRWPEKSSEVRQELHCPQEGTDLREQKKTPKQTSRRVGKQEIHKGRHLVQVHGAFRDMGHTPAHAVLFPIDTRCFLTFGYPVCVCEGKSQCICHYVSLFVKRYL